MEKENKFLWEENKEILQSVKNYFSLNPESRDVDTYFKNHSSIPPNLIHGIIKTKKSFIEKMEHLNSSKERIIAFLQEGKIRAKGITHKENGEDFDLIDSKIWQDVGGYKFGCIDQSTYKVDFEDNAIIDSITNEIIYSNIIIYDIAKISRIKKAIESGKSSHKVSRGLKSEIKKVFDEVCLQPHENNIRLQEAIYRKLQAKHPDLSKKYKAQNGKSW